MRMKSSIPIAFSLLPFVAMFATPVVVAQSAEHVAAVKDALRAAYAISESDNGCPNATDDLFGWPKERLRRCDYAMRDKTLGHPRKAVVWLLEVTPETIARWIESACTKVQPALAHCFDRVLRSGRDNSGYMFAVTGNVIEDMEEKGAFKNYFFRNGMTVSVSQGVNGRGQELSIDAQAALAMTADEKILSIPSGKTRFWGTLPREFAARFPDAHAPNAVVTREQRLIWLELVRNEILTAVESSSNRLLEAWLCSNLRLLGHGLTCSAS